MNHRPEKTNPRLARILARHETARRANEGVGVAAIGVIEPSVRNAPWMRTLTNAMGQGTAK